MNEFIQETMSRLGAVSKACGCIPTAVIYAFGAVLLAAIAVLTISLLRTRKNATVSGAGDSALPTPDASEKAFLNKIEAGLANQEFKMYLQFIVDNKTKGIMSAEALSRWETAAGEIIPPGKFIPAMEKFGLIARLDYYMFEMACKKLENWKNGLLSHLTVSCNFTRITISEQDFVARLQEIAEKYTFDRRKLLIEITEDAVEQNHSIAMSNIRKAKALGFRIALDDIGSGYTSLINLCEYPLDVVKIDRDILLKTDKPRGKKLFWGIISLAHYLNLEVVCEGVETEAHNTLVSESDCDYIQGWYYSKVLPEFRAEAFAKEHMQVC